MITIVRLDKPFWVRCGDSRIRVQPAVEPPEDARAYLRAVIVGWENVRDQEGDEAPFASELIDRLPWDILLRVLRCAKGLDDPLADRSGTSSPPSSAAPTGKTPTPG
jgi:hypothetical protein